MINLNDDKIRREFDRRYLNAETTLEEECLLADFLNNTDIALSAEEEDVLLLLQTADFIGRPEIVKEKVDEFDRLMQKDRSKKSRYVAIRRVASVAAAVICAALLLPTLKTDWTNMEKQNRIGAPKFNDISTSELLETVRFLSEIETNDVIITVSSCNEGFIVKTTDSNGPSTSYMLKRCSDGTSIELKSQLINF